MPVEVSRRNVAKSTAWAVPALAVAASAPAMAASSSVVGAAVCNLFYGTGTASTQYHTIYFQLSSSTNTIPAGSVITNQVCVNTSTSGNSTAPATVPSTTYPANGDFTVTVTDSSGNALSPGSGLPAGGCFNVVFTFKNDVNPSSYGCLNGVTWNDTYTLPPSSTITVTQNASVSGATSAGTGTVTYKTATRAPNSINGKGRVPMTFTGITGSVTCYPSVSSSAAMSASGADNVVCYPNGVNITTSRCTWSGTICSGTTGQCTPPYKANGATSQTNIPAMC